MRATMGDKKTTHFGRAGEYFAMSELLLRGWNVAVPVVDDDVFVIDDRDKATRRLQVKTSAIREGYVETAKTRAGAGRRPVADEGAKTDDLLLKIEIDGNEVKGWGASLSRYLDQWPDGLGLVAGGPGSTPTDATVESVEDLDPSPDPGR